MRLSAHGPAQQQEAHDQDGQAQDERETPAHAVAHLAADELEDGPDERGGEHRKADEARRDAW